MNELGNILWKTFEQQVRAFLVETLSEDGERQESMDPGVEGWRTWKDRGTEKKWFLSTLIHPILRGAGCTEEQKSSSRKLLVNELTTQKVVVVVSCNGLFISIESKIHRGSDNTMQRKYN